MSEEERKVNVIVGKEVLSNVSRQILITQACSFVVVVAFPLHRWLKDA